MYGMKALNTTSIYKNGSLDTTIIIDNPERHPLNNYSANINLLQHFKAEEQLSINLDYIYYNDANTLTYLNNFYSGNGSFIYSDRTKSNKETPIHFWVATANYSKKLGKKMDMEAGVKSTFSTFINDVRVERELQNNWTIDNDLTARHNLKERILAAYTSFNITFNEKTKSKIGVRYEYTNSNLGSETKKNIVDRQYGNLFPSVFLSHALNDKSSLNFSYNRRITRPTFNEMAPFIYFVDPNTFFSGNPALQPSISDAVKVDYLLKPFIFSLSYTYEKNTITNFTPTVDPVKNKQTFAGQNQQYKHMANATVSLPITATKWWTMQNNITGQWNQLHALYKGVPLIITQPALQLNSTQSFVLPKDYSIEVNGNYQSGGFFGFFRMKSFLSLNFGLQKKLPNNKGSLVFNVTDFSGPPRYKLYIDAPEQNLISYFNGRFTVTTFKLTYSRNFGSSKVKANRTRTTGSEEEKQRVQAN
jgi:outer membrane receptor protein involved in Fe transport